MLEGDPCLGAVFRDELHRCYQLLTTKGSLQFVSRVRTRPNHLLSARPCRRERDPLVPVPNLEQSPELLRPRHGSALQRDDLGRGRLLHFQHRRARDRVGMIGDILGVGPLDHRNAGVVRGRDDPDRHARKQ